ncbi:hypothetical protein O181_122121 [Austropuccinia psidii MF-1]|uniref:Uncharacterized protein n=1 Tax=Austropuccinia psidii MF-1 TaxID=1389203 RepID=A0A9Q3KKW8_9BASI|nr:hypothetical protein [Austropuccinia psidii MF-1]
MNRCTRANLASIVGDCFTSHRASRQRQSSHVSHENVTQSPNPFQHYAQRSCNFTSLASASPTLSMLTHPHRPPSR